jgi:release factor glutamine methyltransferase
MTAVHTQTIGAVLDVLAARIAGPLSPPARQEARDLIAAVLDVPRFWPSAHRDQVLTIAQYESIDVCASRLAQGMPFAYAVRRAPFRNLSLYVDERVLIPRPETEMLVDLVLDSTSRGSGLAIDVGTGSGCLALALATEGAFDRVIATDISSDAVEVARVNVGGTSGIDVRSGNYLAPCRGERASVIVSNPPYIAWSEAGELPALVRDWEPATSLFADDNGMAAIRTIASEAIPVLNGGGLLALEIDSRRGNEAADMIRGLGAYRDVVVRADLTGRARFMLARRAED